MAADDVKGKKRKSATEPAQKPKKQKKADEATTLKKTSAKALKAAVEPIDTAPVNIKVKPTRKRAEDFFENDPPATSETAKEKKGKKGKANVVIDVIADVPQASEKPKKGRKAKTAEVDAVLDVAVVAKEPKELGKKSKKGKQAKEAQEEAVAAELDVIVSNGKKAKKTKASKKQKGPSPEVSAESSDDEDEDDQTAALLAGFESDRDESDLNNDEPEDAVEIAKIKLTADKRKQLKAAAKNDGEPGVVYVGRIPHGFYEPQMKGYFSQFGTVNRVRVSRNKKTGASKHYAFVEFASGEVAEIVAQTMDNYLMFGHILQCKVVPTAQVHPTLFAGANSRFRRMPRNKIAGNEMARGAERVVWEKRVTNEEKKRAGKSKKLKEVFDYEYTAPSLKAVDDIPKKLAAIEDGPTKQLFLEAPDEVIVTEAVAPKKPKKGAKSAKAVPEEVIEQVEIVEAVEPKKGKKGKKAKAVVTEVIEEVEIVPVAEETVKPKKTKKSAKADVAADDGAVPEKKKRKAKAATDEADKPKKAKKAKA